MGRSATSLLSELGICGPSLRQAVSNIPPGVQAKVGQLTNVLTCLFDQS